MMAKDYDVGLTMVADTCEYTNIPMSTVEGPAGVRAVLEPFFAPTLRNEFAVRHQAVVGPIVFLERLDRHLLPKGWVELPVAPDPVRRASGPRNRRSGNSPSHRPGRLVDRG